MLQLERALRCAITASTSVCGSAQAWPQMMPSPGRTTLLRSTEDTAAALIELAVQYQLVAHGAGEAQLQVPFTQHIQIEPDEVFAGPFARTRLDGLLLVLSRHRWHLSGHRHLGAAHRLVGARQAHDAVIDQVLAARLALHVAARLRPDGQRGEQGEGGENLV